VVRLHSGDVWPEAERKLWLELPEGLIYKGKDAAANRGGLPTFTGLVFLRQRYNPQWLSRQPPKLHRESHWVSRA